MSKNIYKLIHVLKISWNNFICLWYIYLYFPHLSSHQNLLNIHSMKKWGNLKKDLMNSNIFIVSILINGYYFKKSSYLLIK